MNFELFISPNIVQWLTSPAQSGFQLETQWAIAIAVGLLLLGAFIGLMIGWLVTGRDLNRTRNETDQLRVARDNAQSARAQAMNERERAMRELHGKQQEFALLESQARSTQKQLDQAQAALRVSEQQAEELAASARSLRTQVDDLRKRLAESEQVSSERQMTLAQLSSELNETQARYNETQRLAAERQATLGSVTAQLSEYRARIAEADISTAEMQATLLSLGSQLEAHRMRLAEIERRAQTPKEALAPSAAKAAPVANAANAKPEEPAASSAPTSAPTNAQAHARGNHTSSFRDRDDDLEADDEDDADADPNLDGNSDVQDELDDETHTMAGLQQELNSIAQQLQALRSSSFTPSESAQNRSSRPALRKPDGNGARHTNGNNHAPAANGKSSAPQQPQGQNPFDDEPLALELESVKGIGAAYASRLRAGGIQSIKDLANTTPGYLETIIKAPKWRQPDYASWIRYARMMVRSSNG